MVLAAVETAKDVYGGSNVENVNYSLTKHAEEVAILAAIHAGAGPRGGWIQSLYVAGPPPCGSCRQFIFEFGRPQTTIFVDRLTQNQVRHASLPDLSEDSVETWRLDELLPGAFKPTHLKRRRRK
jgi:cytidine deaminase